MFIYTKYSHENFLFLDKRLFTILYIQIFSLISIPEFEDTNSNENALRRLSSSGSGSVGMEGTGHTNTNSLDKETITRRRVDSGRYVFSEHDFCHFELLHFVRHIPV